MHAQVGARHPDQQRVGVSDETWQHRHPETLPYRDDLSFGIRGPEGNFHRADLALARPVGEAMVVLDAPPAAIGRSGAPRGEEVAGHIDSAEQLRPFHAVKVERQRIAVVDDAHGDVGLSIGQIYRLVGRQDLHLDLGMQACEFGEIRHEKVRREARRQRHPQQPAHALVATKDTRLQLIRRRFHLDRELEHPLARIRETVARRQLLEHVRPETRLEVGDAPQHGGMIDTEPLGSGPDRTVPRDGKEVTNVIPLYHRVRSRAAGAPSDPP